MKPLTASFLVLLFARSAFAQINLSDSTVQVIGYWYNGERQSYVVTQEKYKIQGLDTTSKELATHEVDITITDSTATSYTIEWLYKNFSTQGDNLLLRKLSALSENLRVVITTDEMGAFVEVVNWEEVRDFMRKGFDLIGEDLKSDPKTAQVLTQLTAMFSSREAIQSVAIKDILQYYTFHGARYKLNEEYSAAQRVSNMFGGEPFDTELTVLLDEIDPDNDDCVLRLWQEVDSTQTTEASYEFIKKTALATGSTPPRREAIQPLSIEDRTASRIHGSSGWVLFTINTREVTTEGLRTIEFRSFDIK